MRLAVLALVAVRAAAFSLRVLHVNDHHSHIEASAYSFLTTIEEDIAYGGWALMVSAFAALAGDGENVLKVHAGDAITGTSYYSLFDGAPDAAVMNQVCFDAFAVGNHEFDDGDAALADFLDLLAGDGRAHGRPVRDLRPRRDVDARRRRLQPRRDAVPRARREADVAVQNGGGCRVDIAAGDFTIEDGYEVLPFSNTIVTLDLTGAQLADALEALAQPLDDGGSTGSYPTRRGSASPSTRRGRAGRASAASRSTRARGRLGARRRRRLRGRDERLHRGGKDGYHTFGALESADTFLLYTQSFLDYLEDIDGPVPAPDEADFSTTSFTDAAGCLHTSANVGACAPAEDEPPAAEEADDGAGACFSAPGEALREACACDATCATCGYDATASDSVTGPDDCITCLAVGDCVTAIYDDGTGPARRASPTAPRRGARAPSRRRAAVALL
ncbi:hypothetical protein JL720_3081 [Aureococcus anophagefferens]|nr:hypothetical protein JL720_3081 [Aureococcus anophagefferens]